MAAISFKLFKNSCEERGYTERVYETPGVCVLYSNNGIKCEIKKKHYTIGWDAKPEYVKIMREKFIDAGFTENRGKRAEKRKDDRDFMNIPFDGDVLENFWVLLGIIESIETIVKKVRGQAIKPIPREVSPAFLLTYRKVISVDDFQVLLLGDHDDHYQIAHLLLLEAYAFHY